MSVTEKTNRWRTVQFFIENEASGVCEVQSDTAGKFRCTCAIASSGKTCRHIRFVKKKAEDNNGTYPLQVSIRASSKEIANAQKDPNKFREFVLKYGRIEIL